MRILAGIVFSALAFAAASTIRAFGHDWTVPNASDWSVDGEGNAVIVHLVTPRGPLPGPRRPIQFALANTGAFRKVSIEADAKPLQRSLIFVFAYRDPAHFDYAHLSVDTAVKQPVHNGIFHVYGGERVRISSPNGPPAFPESDRWYRVHLVWDGASGAVVVSVDGKEIPALKAVDRSLTDGKIGIGSFDETADFKNISFTGVPE